jgi:arylsulfatase A-like enzyme
MTFSLFALRRSVLAVLAVAGATLHAVGSARPQPNVILLMADDMGWGETGYQGHPVLQTPALDAMAANGLRFDRFYAGAPVCSPTRASVLTGRVNDRAGVREQGYALRLQERTLAQALRRAGYATGHFGKWHLDGIRGPGVPVLATDSHHPGVFGFEEWLTTTNFFDLDPLLSRQGKFERFAGDSSEVIVTEALDFITRQQAAGRPFLAVIWYGSPHAPFAALPGDLAPFAALDADSAAHYGELVALDRSLGSLRRRLRELGLADNTLVIFCSDNGGLPGVTPETVGGLRGHKGRLYEGGIRVPAIMEWPGVIPPGRRTAFPAATMDIFPTLADILALPGDAMLSPVDGMSLRPLFDREVGARPLPIGFRFRERLAWIDGRYKLLIGEKKGGGVELYDLEADSGETRDLSGAEPALTGRLRAAAQAWAESVAASGAGKDYPEGRLRDPDPVPIQWADMEAYRSYFKEWSTLPAYQEVLQSGSGAKSRAKVETDR